MEEDHVTKWLVGGKSRARPWLRDGVGEPAFPALSLRVPWGRNSVQGRHLYSCRGGAQSEGTAERVTGQSSCVSASVNFQETCQSLSFPFCKMGMVIIILSSCT